MRSIGIVFVVVVFGLAGCGAEIGEDCEDSGSPDECVDGAVCTREATQTVCRQLCETQDDCPTGTTCNGISNGNLKSCQPD